MVRLGDVATYTGIDDIPLVAGHPALDLVNTVEPRLPRSAPGEPAEAVLDHFAVPSAVLLWGRRSGLLTEAEAAAEEAAWRSAPELAERCRDAVVAAREALYDVLTDSSVDPQLGLLSANWATAAGRSQLRPTRSGRPEFEQVVGTEPGLVLLDRISVAVVQLLTTADLGLLRACPLEEGGCGWLFLDRSRGRTRRWCVMADCGTKAKARRLNDRRRTARQRS